ncbi:MAG: hypothetical protein QY332_01490 [Anaerolineales bacterium]|nr:MAG: hypothetical protein QY332_01490 [Anaerolineales bacterium]
MDIRRALSGALVLLMTVLACALPGQPSASPLLPTPDTRLEIMVAETVSAALELTRQAVPSATLSPTSTPESMIAQVDSSGSALTTGEDGSALFRDERGKYQITTPGGWLAVRINQQEFLDAALLPQVAHPAFQRSLDSVQGQDPNLFRLFLFDLNEEHIDGGFVTNVNFLWNEQEEISLENETSLMELADALPDSLPGSEVLTVELLPLENGTKAGIITSRLEAITLDDVAVVLFQKQVLIDLPIGTLSITFSTTETWRGVSEPLFDAMIESFKHVD